MSSLPDILKSALSNAPSLIANISVLVIFASIVGAGVIRGVKEFREFQKPADPPPSIPSQIAAATILENVTLNEWSRSNHEVTVAITRLCDMLAKHHDETADLRRTVEDISHWLKHRG